MSNGLLRFCVIIALISGSIFISACNMDEGASTNSSNTVNTSNPGASSGTSRDNKVNSTYYGGIDFRDCQAVKGWVWNSADPKADIKVSFYIDDKLIETLPARTFRADLKAQNIGTGEYAFAFKIPSSFKDGKLHTFSVKTANGDYTLPGIPGLYLTAACEP